MMMTMMKPRNVVSFAPIIASLVLLMGLSSLSGVEARSDSPRIPLPIVPYDETNDSEKALTALLGELDSFVSDAVSYLVRISHTADQDPKFPGRFTYQADLREALHPTMEAKYWAHHEQPDYNLLRHNGAIYALSEAYLRNERKRSVVRADHKPSMDRQLEVVSNYIRDTMERAVGYLRDNALLPVPEHKEEWLAAWERVDPDDPHSEPDTAKLGGAGLAMIALARLEGIKPNAVCEEELRKLGAFVESLQNKVDGSFICKYQWGVGPYDEWVSLYYPGEAALGLVMLAEFELSLEEQQQQQQQAKKSMVHSGEAQLELHHYSHGHHHHDETTEKHSKRWIKVATDALLYLERLRRDLPLEEVEADHWALLATARLLPILDQQRQSMKGRERKQVDLEYWLVYNHGVKVANSIVADHTTAGLMKHNGCFTYDSRTCPTATRLEGLLAAMTFIQDSELYMGGEDDAAELLKDRIERDVGMGIRFLLNAQQKTDRNTMRGAVPGKFMAEGSKQQHHEDNNASGDETDEAFELAEVRVDYVQHSLSAVIAYESFLLDKLEKNKGEKAFHEKVEEVYKLYHKVKHHVKHKFDIATASEAMVNYAILAGIGFLVSVVVCLAYSPCSIFSFLAGRRRRRRRNKRRD